MLSAAVKSITRQSSRKEDEKLNILTFPTHERYETNLCKTGHNFYSFRANGIKDWNTNYGDVPDNYVLLDPSKDMDQIPKYVDFDIILSQNKAGQFQIAKQLSEQMHVPLLSLEHTLPFPQWGDEILKAMREMRGQFNVFISEFSIDSWGWKTGNDTGVVHHGIDTDQFKPNNNIEREDHALSVVNDWINRDWCCGFNIWQDVIKGLPYKVVGDTPGLSKPAASTEELVATYQNSRIFLNTSTISPVPTALLEAMSCGCAVVSTETCMIPEIINNEENGFMSNDPEKLKQYVIDLLNDEDLAKEMGKKARETILKKFTLDSFTKTWNKVFGMTSNLIVW